LQLLAGQILIVVALLRLRRKKNNPRKLKHCREQMDDNSGEERPERVKYCDVEDLQPNRAGS